MEQSSGGKTGTTRRTSITKSKRTPSFRDFWKSGDTHLQMWSPESYLSPVSAEGEIRAAGLPRTPFSRLMIALIDSADLALRRGPVLNPKSDRQKELAKTYEETVTWAQEECGLITLSEACAYLRAQGLSADETKIRQSWASLITGHAASQYVPSRRAVLVSPVTGASSAKS